MSRLVTALLVAYAVLHHLGRTSGTDALERRRTLPGDEIVPHPDVRTAHAATLPVPPDEVWPWLIQMGWHQGGWYTARWVDRMLFPANLPAADSLIDELQHRTVGDFIPDGPPESECGFTIERCEPGRLLVLHSTTHLPLAWRRRGATLNWVWTFHLEPVGGGRTRFLFRTRGTLGPWWALALYHLAVVPADHIMSTQMIHGLERRVVRRHALVEPDSTPLGGVDARQAG